MCLPCLPTSSLSSILPENPVLHLFIDEEQPEPSTDSPLQFNALQLPLEIDSYLGTISHELDASIDQGRVSVAPQLAVMNISSDKPSSSPPVSVPSVKNDLENPPVVTDYSAHGDQVNC